MDISHDQVPHTIVQLLINTLNLKEKVIFLLTTSRPVDISYHVAGKIVSSFGRSQKPDCIFCVEHHKDPQPITLSMRRV